MPRPTAGHTGRHSLGTVAAAIRGGDGCCADLLFAWLAADAALTDPSKSGPSRRSELLLFAGVAGEGVTRSTEPVVLIAGSRAVAACSRQHPFAVVHVEVAATPGGAGEVAFRDRVQQAPPRAADPMPDSVATARSPESAPLRVRYGASAAVLTTDQNQRAWTSTRAIDRLGGAGG